MAKTTALLLLVLLALLGLATPAGADDGPTTIPDAAAQLRAAHRAAAITAVTAEVPDGPPPAAADATLATVAAPAATPAPTPEPDVPTAEPPAASPAGAPIRATAQRTPPPTTSTTVVVRDGATGGILIRGTSAEILGPAVTIEAGRPTEVLGSERSRSLPAPGQPGLTDGRLAVTGRATDDLTALALGLLAIGTLCLRAGRPRHRSRKSRTTGRPPWGGPLRVRRRVL